MKEKDTIFHRPPGRKRDDIHETPDVSYIKNPNVAYEHTDVSVRPIAWFVVGLSIFTVVVCVVVYLLFNIFQQREMANEVPESPLARQGAERLPPEPRLQLAPGFQAEGQPLELKEPQAEMKVVREKWEHDLNNYGWVDEGAGTVRLPIKQAIELMIQREAEKAKGRPASQDETLPMPSSSGQQLEKRNQ